MTEASLAALAARLADRGQLVRRDLAAATPLRPGAMAATDPLVRAVRYDSRLVEPGDLFVARPGQNDDGHDHAAGAVSAGAIAVVAERPIGDLDVPRLLVRDAKASLAIAAAWRAGDPSQRLGVVGITGTDGKTTTAYLVRAILEAAGHRTGLISTTNVIVGGESLGNAARATTPEAPQLQEYLAAMLEAGDAWAIVESTSHGLAQQRVGAVAYDVAVLTNVTSEHLEFHGTLEAYRDAKRSLFARLAVDADNPDKGHGKHAVINADDGLSSSFVTTALDSGARLLRYSAAALQAEDQASPRGSEPVDLAAVRLEESAAGMRVAVRSDTWRGEVALRLAGRFNVHNALAALGVARSLHIDMDLAAAALGDLRAVPGRMQRVDEGQPFTVVIDYAHTAGSLGKVLDELAPVRPGAGLIAVFGSGGERDTQKRAVMGRVAAARCRLLVITDEDPRHEDRHAILEAIASGAEASGRRRGEDLLLIADRSDAIAAALAQARAGDVVLLAGKGHEKTIETAAGAQAWDEEEAARSALRVLGYG